jgi:hypothetical protein
MSLNVLAAADAAGIDATYIVLDYPFPLTDFGGNAHGFVGVERETIQTTLAWLTDNVPEASTFTAATKIANQNPPGNLEPIADAGEMRIVLEDWIVTLDSSESFDLDGAIVSSNWRQVSGQSAAISGADQVRATVVIPPIVRGRESLIFEVTVIDDHGGSDSAEVEMVAIKEELAFETSGVNSLGPVVIILLLGAGIRRRTIR